MKPAQLTQVIRDVFQPQVNESVLFLVDIPHDSISDNSAWQARRQMAQQWLDIFHPLVKDTKLINFPATGQHNQMLSDEVIEQASPFNIIIAMTEYSASAPLKKLIKQSPDSIRVASLPTVEKRMEETAFQANYQLVKRYALALKELLSAAESADIFFNTQDHLHIDLRFRTAEADTGDCSQAGQFINFPSGEAFIVPYEGSAAEKLVNGPSLTEGIWPVAVDQKVIKMKVSENQVAEISGPNPACQTVEKIFQNNPARRNLAELGLGCNPKAVVSGNVLEDEKVGLHLAYGTSSHFTGGTVTADCHEDIVYAQGCPIEGTKVTLNFPDRDPVDIVERAKLRYELL